MSAFEEQQRGRVRTGYGEREGEEERNRRQGPRNDGESVGMKERRAEVGVFK